MTVVEPEPIAPEDDPDVDLPDEDEPEEDAPTEGEKVAPAAETKQRRPANKGA